jgi:hypothetical protein
MKFHPVGAELFRTDRRTDMTKIMVTFRNFANAPDKPAAVLALSLYLLFIVFAQTEDCRVQGAHELLNSAETLEAI